MKRFSCARSLTATALSVLFTMTGCGGAASGSGANSPTSGGGSGTMAPDFTARDVDGKTFRMSDHLGKEVILLDFWTTFCEPCKAEFPHLRELYAAQKAKGFIVIGIAMDGPETSADVPGFKSKYNLNFPLLMDEDSRIASLYNPKKTAPLSILIDKQGKIVVVREGYNPGDEELVTRDVVKALDQAGAAK